MIGAAAYATVAVAIALVVARPRVGRHRLSPAAALAVLALWPS